MKQRLWAIGLSLAILSVGGTEGAFAAPPPPGGNCEAIECESVQDDCHWTCTQCTATGSAARHCAPNPVE